MVIFIFQFLGILGFFVGLYALWHEITRSY